MVLLGGDHLAHNRAREVVHLLLGEHIKLCHTIDRHHVYAHHGLVAWTERVHHERRTRVERVGTERSLVVISRLYEQRRLAHPVEPVCYLVVRIGLA